MTEKTSAAYKKVVELISDEGVKLSPGDYREFIEELEGHIVCKRIALDEEDEDAEDNE